MNPVGGSRIGAAWRTDGGIAAATVDTGKTHGRYLATGISN